MRFGDKAYDKRKNFNILDEINAEPAISIERMHPILNIVNELKLMYDDIVEWQRRVRNVHILGNCNSCTFQKKIGSVGLSTGHGNENRTIEQMNHHNGV